MCSPHKAGPGLKHLRFQFFSARFARRAAHVPGCTRQPQCTSKFSIFFRCARRAIVSVGPSAHRDFVAELKGSSGCGGVFRRRATAGSISGTPSLKLSVHVFDFGQTQAKSPEFPVSEIVLPLSGYQYLDIGEWRTAALESHGRGRLRPKLQLQKGRE